MTNPNDLDALADELERVFSRTRTTQHIAVDAGLVQDILTALRSIAAPKQDGEVVAWRYMNEVTCHMWFLTDERWPEKKRKGWIEEPLYAHPPAKPDAPAESLADRQAREVMNPKARSTKAEAGAQLYNAPAEPAGDAEQCVMVCPQCQGEGFYADGLDEAACSTECTRCGSNGWIVDLAALRNQEHLKND